MSAATAPTKDLPITASKEQVASSNGATSPVTAATAAATTAATTAVTRIVLVGKGGSGKDYLRKILVSRGLVYQISYTTRPPRPEEKHGHDYWFIDAKTAQQMTDNQHWAYKVSFNSWTYGTTKEQFAQGGVFIMTPDALKQLSASDRASCIVMYLNPPQAILEQRLKARNMPGDTFARRIAADQEQFATFSNFDIMIENPNF